VLFDFGGVLTAPLGERFATFFMETGVDPERFRDVLADAYAPLGPGPGGAHRAGPVADLETGRMPVGDFEVHLAAELSVGLAAPLPAEGLARRIFGELAADPEMLGVVAAVRSLGLATGLVSNTWGDAPAIREIAGSFDTIVLSHEEACRKPEPRIYLLAAERLGLEPEVCVFVDDIPTNVEGARAVGMAGVLHRHPSLTVPRLETIVGAGLGRPESRLPRSAD
jgi:epoxide hydrolase-like predicted phosphatase